MKNCPEEKREREQKAAIMCANCNNEGHRARDCPEPRKTSRGKGCRNCGQEGHISKECPEPPNLDNVECKNCNKSEFRTPLITVRNGLTFSLSGALLARLPGA